MFYEMILYHLKLSIIMNIFICIVSCDCNFNEWNVILNPNKMELNGNCNDISNSFTINIKQISEINTKNGICFDDNLNRISKYSEITDDISTFNAVGFSNVECNKIHYGGNNICNCDDINVDLINTDYNDDGLCLDYKLEMLNENCNHGTNYFIMGIHSDCRHDIFDVRLNGDTPYHGRLQIYYNKWFDVCGDIIDMNVVNVICKQLGYIYDGNICYSSEYASTDGILLNAICNGDEMKLDECIPANMDVQTCDVNNDYISIFCNPSEIVFTPNMLDDINDELFCFSFNGNDTACASNDNTCCQCPNNICGTQNISACCNSTNIPTISPTEITLFPTMEPTINCQILNENFDACQLFNDTCCWCSDATCGIIGIEPCCNITAVSTNVTDFPTTSPTPSPTPAPTDFPTPSPSDRPTPDTVTPTFSPTSPPTNITDFPTAAPTSAPTPAPSVAPTIAPTPAPSLSPTSAPTREPTSPPTDAPTNNPTQQPTQFPTNIPTANPSISPSLFPTEIPTDNPSQFPSNNPSTFPTFNPTQLPTQTPTQLPTKTPTDTPTQSPTFTESPTNIPSNSPSISPSLPPTQTPTLNPTNIPTQNPTQPPTQIPTNTPTQSPSNIPSLSPSIMPTQFPTKTPTQSPSLTPTQSPSITPSISPTDDTELPTPNVLDPTSPPTRLRTRDPSAKPTDEPTGTPTANPTNNPTNNPTDIPTNIPTNVPTNIPSNLPTNPPSIQPTIIPSMSPSFKPTFRPTREPTTSPIKSPTFRPTKKPIGKPTYRPSPRPTRWPTWKFRLPTPWPTHPWISKGGWVNNKPTYRPTDRPTYDWYRRRTLNMINIHNNSTQLNSFYGAKYILTENTTSDIMTICFDNNDIITSNGEFRFGNNNFKLHCPMNNVPHICQHDNQIISSIPNLRNGKKRKQPILIDDSHTDCIKCDNDVSIKMGVTMFSMNTTVSLYNYTFIVDKNTILNRFIINNWCHQTNNSIKFDIEINTDDEVTNLVSINPYNILKEYVFNFDNNFDKYFEYTLINSKYLIILPKLSIINGNILDINVEIISQYNGITNINLITFVSFLNELNYTCLVYLIKNNNDTLINDKFLINNNNNTFQSDGHNIFLKYYFCIFLMIIIHFIFS